MNITNCRLCGQRFNKPLWALDNMPATAQYLPAADTLKNDRGVRLAVYQCSGCGLVQLANRPVAYYREVVRAAGFSPEMKKFRERQFADFLKKYRLAGKKIVEIGCGRGEYLEILSRFKVKTFGLEYGRAAAADSARRGLFVRRGFVAGRDYKITGAPFDAFLMLSFLEHLPDPRETLLGIGRNLSAGAVGLVEVPNFDMIIRNKLFSEFMTDHLFYFTKNTLETVLRLSGFQVLELKENWHDYLISATVKKRPALDLSDFPKRRRIIKNQMEKYLGRFKRVAIWGAGHQSLAVISLLGLADKISYVIDSAPFKQGKYTPATHLPIVSPDKLLIDPVKAVIIIAAGYSDEVAAIIRKNFSKKISLAILRDFGLEQV